MRVKLFIHVAVMNNWEAILTELMEDIRISKMPYPVQVVSVGGTLPAKYGAINTKEELTAYEYPTLIHLYENRQQYDIVGYCHLKGVSQPYSMTHVAWRRDLSSFLIHDWQNRMLHLKSRWTSGPRITPGGAGYSTAHVNAHKHYSGNFWWANTSYLEKLPSPREFQIRCNNNRFGAEAWLGQSPLINERIV